VYVEPFFGGGSVFFAKQPSDVEIINDQNDLLITFFSVLRDSPDEFIGKFDFTLLSRSLFNMYRKTKWSEITDPVERAFRFYYLVRNSYCGLYRVNSKGEFNAPFCRSTASIKQYGIGRFTGQFFDVDWVEQIHNRLKTVIIECSDYKDVLERFDGKDTFFFMDPPYDTDYTYDIQSFDYDDLLDVIRSLQGQWILTLNSELEQKFSEFSTFKVAVPENVSAEKRGKVRYDVIIRSKGIKREVSARL
jgi:DNA adenine methylase